MSVEVCSVRLFEHIVEKGLELKLKQSDVSLLYDRDPVSEHVHKYWKTSLETHMWSSVCTTTSNNVYRHRSPIYIPFF